MATTTITANATTRRPAEITKASYAPLAVLALAQIGTSSDSAAMNLATASLVGTLGATLDDIQMATTLFSLIAGAFMIAGGLVGVTIGLHRALAMGLSLAVAGEMVAALSPNIFAFTWGGRVIMGLGACLITPSVLGLVAALYQGRQRAIAFGTIAGAAALSTLSPLILGIVMDSSGFRLTFAIMAIYFVLVLCCTRLVPRTPPLRQSQPLRCGRHHRGRSRHGARAVRSGAPLGLGHRQSAEALPLHLVRTAPHPARHPHRARAARPARTHRATRPTSRQPPHSRRVRHLA